MFILKKILGILLAPGTILLMLLAGALLLQWRAHKTKRTATVWLFLALAGCYLMTTATLPNLLLRPLESRYPPFGQVATGADIKYIVILAGGPCLRATVPAASVLNVATVRRVLEGVRLYYLLEPRPVLVMSGNGERPAAVPMAELARSLGVPPDNIVVESKSRDTHGNALAVRELIQEAPFLLVTSAVHLPRSMAIFQQLGMQPLPAPADFRSQEGFSWKDLLPRARHLNSMEVALHEYLGLAYLRLFPSRAGR